MTQRNEGRTHCVARRIDRAWQADEWCRLVETPAGIELSGALAGARDGVPFRIDYTIECNPAG